MLIFILTLIERNLDILYIERTIINFVILTRYRFYNNKILRYINAILTRIDLLKKIFRAYKLKDKIIN